MKVLLAIDQADADKYQAHYADIEDAKVLLVSEPNRIEGRRISEAFATPRARMHDRYWECVEIVHHCRFLTTRSAPRVA
jgi:hypothetical protein